MNRLRYKILFLPLHRKRQRTAINVTRRSKRFMISKDGETIKRFAPTAEPKDFEKDIEEMLS